MSVHHLPKNIPLRSLQLSDSVNTTKRKYDVKYDGTQSFGAIFFPRYLYNFHVLFIYINIYTNYYFFNYYHYFSAFGPNSFVIARETRPDLHLDVDTYWTSILESVF